jgi:hypothetical protein
MYFPLGIRCQSRETPKLIQTLRRRIDTPAGAGIHFLSHRIQETCAALRCAR